MTRDPRIHPAVGEQFIGPKSCRIVQRVDFIKAEIGFTYWRVRDGEVLWGAGNDAYTSLETWRRWAVNAQVVMPEQALRPADSGAEDTTGLQGGKL